MRDFKHFCWWLLMPLWIIYFPLGLILAFISLILSLMGFRDLPDLITSTMTIPYDYWMELYQGDY